MLLPVRATCFLDPFEDDLTELGAGSGAGSGAAGAAAGSSSFFFFFFFSLTSA